MRDAWYITLLRQAVYVGILHSTALCSPHLLYTVVAATLRGLRLKLSFGKALPHHAFLGGRDDRTRQPGKRSPEDAGGACVLSQAAGVACPLPGAG